MPRVLEIAIQTAVAKRGVSVVALPGDIALCDAVEQQPRVAFREQKTTVCPSDEEIALLAKVLNESEKITILGGAGCAGAHAELIEVAGKLNAPIVHALRGKEFIEYNNPFDVGMTGLLGFSSGYHAMMDCNTLLMIGTDFPYQQFFPKQATIIQIDLRGEQLGRRTKLDYGFVGDAKSTLLALLPKLDQNRNKKHLNAFVEHYRKARKGLDELAIAGMEQKGSHSQYVARELDALASEDAIFSCDVGTPTVCAARYLTMNGKRRSWDRLPMAQWPTHYPKRSGRNKLIPIVRSSRYRGTVGSPCSWAICFRFISWSCRSRSLSLRTTRLPLWKWK
jgi:pyruvate dehydrogenase (quinone)